jgi:hypothetical protein
MTMDGVLKVVADAATRAIRQAFGKSDGERILKKLGGVPIGPEWLKLLEQESMQIQREQSDRKVGKVLASVFSSDEVERVVVDRARKSKNLKNGGRRDKSFTLYGGATLTVQALYFRKDLKGRPGPRRGTGKRGKGGQGAGFFPLLRALGIDFEVTPAAADEITREVVSSESVRVARDSLDRRKLDLGHGAVLRVVNKVGRRAVKQLDSWIAAQLEAGPRSEEQAVLSGRRVVVAVDGGRIRLRVPKAGRPKKNGHRRYDTPWVEPKQLCIYVVDDEGVMDGSWRPVLDATLGDADAIFDHAAAYLLALGANHARELIILGDGAPWIWNRVSALAETVGIDSKRVFCILDTYHALKRLNDIADRLHTDEATRKEWVKKTEAMLRAGDGPGLVATFTALDALFPGEGFATDSDFFKDTARIDYATHREAKRPVGSGAVESAIRRVVNLRIKATTKFWLEENAEHMLRLRSFLKAGRFDDLLDWSMATASSWWNSPPPLLTELSQYRGQRHELAA